MTKELLNSAEVTVIKGYLSKLNKDNKVIPLYHSAFINAQNDAKWIITFAEECKGKDFVGKQADSLEKVRETVADKLSKQDTEYVKTPKPIKREIGDKLTAEALAWINNEKNISKVESINSFMQQFNVLHEFEEIGLFFDTEEIDKLDRIYTIEEITNAVTEVIDLLD